MQNTTSFNIVIPLDKAESRRQCGSKALTIGKLRGMGFEVPNGFCVAADAYRLHLWATGVRHLALSNPTEADRATLRKAISECDLPADALSAIEAAYRELGEDIPVAVRHSASDERVASQGYTSVLGVRGLDALVCAIKQVWASLWSEDAAARRDPDPLTWKEPTMAIVVQTMVDAKASGMAITANVATGNPNEIVIHSTRGVNCVPGPKDQSIVDLVTFRITQTEVAHKARVAKLGPDGVVETYSTLYEADTPSLMPEQVIELAESSIWVQKALGEVRACQWAFDGDKFYFLGAKSAGSLPSYFPLPDDVKEAGEVMWRLACAEPISPFARSLSVFQVESLPSLPSAAKSIAVRCENGWAYRRVIRPRQEISRLLAFRDMRIGTGLYRKWKHSADKIVTESRSVLSTDASELTDQELISATHRSVERVNESMQWFEAISYPSLRFLYLLREALAFIGKDPTLIGRLLREPERLSHEKDLAFQRLSAYAWEALLEGSVELPEKLSTDLAQRFGYSFRGSRDARDPAAWKSWIEDPTLVSKTAAALAQGPLTDIDEAGKLACEDAKAAEKAVFDAIRSSKGSAARVFTTSRFKTLLKCTRAWLAAASARNIVHALAISALRVNMTELGKRLEKSGAISCPEDIFYLTCDEIIKLKSEPTDAEKSAIRRTIMERKHELWLQSRLNPPRWLPIGSGPREAQISSQTGRTYSGIPAHPGEATGIARVALTLDEAAKMKPGEILVVEEIGPAWTPLLGLASGLIMARGDLISPGAVAARDYGIPCVYGVTNATTIICTGHTVSVDGKAGTVEIVKRNTGS